MLYLLEYAGEDISMAQKWMLDDVTRYMVAVRKDREAERATGKKTRLHAIAHIDGAVQRLATKAIDNEVGEDAVSVAAGDTGDDTEDETDDCEDADVEADDYGETAVMGQEEDIFDGEGPTLVEEEEPEVTAQDPTSPPINHGKEGASMNLPFPTKDAPDLNLWPKTVTATLSIAHNYLLAIEQEAIEDAE
jgi:hypothetical protein